MHICPSCQAAQHSAPDSYGASACESCETLFITGSGDAGDGSPCGMRIERTETTFSVSRKQQGVRLYSLLANGSFMGIAGYDGFSTLELAVVGVVGALSAPMLFSRVQFIVSTSTFEVRQGPLALFANLFGPRKHPDGFRVLKESDLEGTTWFLEGRFGDASADDDNGWRLIHRFTNEQCALFTMRSLHDAVEEYGRAPARLPVGHVLPVAVP